MERPVKERLLGGLLLLAIAVIFLPMIFDGAGLKHGRLQSVVPDAPAPIEIVHYQPTNQPNPDTSELAPPQPAPVEKLPEPPKPIEPPEAPKDQVAATPDKGATSAAAKPVKPVSTVTKEKPVLDQQGVPVGWTLQLASFKERPNAVSLQQKLIQRGYKAYIRQKGPLSKVFVGPDNQKSRIEQLKLKLKQEVKLDGLVLRYRP
ncbi:SPOR domain-containing protein [Motiliproteus coralliicola]|uniref:SPOR domain-containing protein n=1 Tax=Motiliproteus coralliicola TaxID=2283196 RepID=A0A369WV98_9GAMM|nr:SPOR domain-containing protein [Motiliproteus coralliicola]RDE24474.1 SPOR domain-containing protein [Motiliproteus coralliicola]